MMKERFSKLLLGEDMSESAKGVSSSLAISNAITNLCVTVRAIVEIGTLTYDKKMMWRREMEWLLCVSDHIVELISSWQTCPDGTKLEVITQNRGQLFSSTSQPFVNLITSSLYTVSLLHEILDSFSETEFWYVDHGAVAPEADGSSSFRKSIQRQEAKWWLPMSRVPAGGLSNNTRKQLHHKRECATQILKAAMAINSIFFIGNGSTRSILGKSSKECGGSSSCGDGSSIAQVLYIELQQEVAKL